MKIKGLLAFWCLCSVATLASAQAKRQPNLDEALGWIQKSLASGEGNYAGSSTAMQTHLTKYDGCVVAFDQHSHGIVGDSPAYNIPQVFNLRDMNPASGKLFRVGDGSSSVTFQTAYELKLVSQSEDGRDVHKESAAVFWLDENYAPRFAKAFRRATELCNRKPEPF